MAPLLKALPSGNNGTSLGDGGEQDREVPWHRTDRFAGPEAEDVAGRLLRRVAERRRRAGQSSALARTDRFAGPEACVMTGPCFPEEEG